MLWIGKRVLKVFINTYGGIEPILKAPDNTRNYNFVQRLPTL